MTYDCPRCDWTSGEDSDGETMPQYIVTDGTQVAHCPHCAKILDTCENTLDDLARRFA